MAEEQNMHLGVLFVGRVDASLKNAVTGLKSTLGQATGSFTQYNVGMQKTSSATQKVVNSQQLLNKQISRVYGGLERIKAALKVTAAYTVAGTAIVAIANQFRNAASEIVNYDQALRNLEAISNATSNELEIMGDTIKQVAAESKFSTSEVGEGMVLLAQSGLSASESISTIRAVTNLATGTLSDYRTVTDLVTTAMRAFNIDALDSARITDVMANAINKSKLTVDKLRTAFNFVGAAASQAHVSLEETAATMMVLANNGLRASTIGTGFRQVLARLISPNDKLREAYKEQGIKLEEINPLTVGYQKAIENLAIVLWDAEKRTIDMGKAFNLFQLRGAQAAAVISKSFASGDFQKALKYSYEIGSAQRMAGIQSEGLAVKLTMLAQRVGVLAIAIGETGLTGVFHDFIDILLSAINTTIKFADTISGSILIQMALWSGSIYVVTKALRGLILWLGVGQGLSKLALSFSVLTAVTTKTKAAMLILGKVFKSATSPISLIAVAVGVLIASYQALIGYAGKYSKEQKKIGTNLQEAANKTKFYAESIKNLFAEMVNGKDKQREIISIIQRAIKEYPELEKAVNNTSGSFIDYQQALDKISEVKAEKSIKVLTNLLKDQTDVLEKVKNYKPEKQLFDFNIGQLPDITDAADEQNETLKLLVSTLNEFVAANILSEEAALNLVAGLAGADEQSRNLSNTVRNSLIRSINAAKEAMFDFSEYMENRYVKVVENMPERFKRIFESLKGIRKIDLIQALSKINKEEASFIKSLETIKLSAKEKEDAIKQFREEALSDALDKINKEQLEVDKSFKYKVKNAKNEADERIAQLKRVAVTNKVAEKTLGIDSAKAELDASKEILSIHNSRILAIKEKYGEEVEIYRQVAQERLDAALAVIEAETKLIEESKKFKDKQLKKEEDDLKDSLGKRVHNINNFFDNEISLTKMRGESIKKDQEKINEEIAQLELTRAKKLYELRKESFKDFVRLYRQDEEEYKDIYNQTLQELKDSETDYNLAVEQLLTARLAVQARNLKRYKKTVEDYLDSIDRVRQDKQRRADYLYTLERKTAEETEYAKTKAAWESAKKQVEAYKEVMKSKESLLLTEDEKKDQVRELIKLETNLKDTELDLVQAQKELNESVRTGSSLWQGFSVGLRYTKKELFSLGEFGEEVGKKFKSGFDDLIDESIEGFITKTKSAKEAFSDFARSTLIWLAQLIVKQLAYNAINGVVSNTGSLGSLVGTFLSLGHGGKESGRSTNISRYTSMLRPDEQVTVVRKNETILTPSDLNNSGPSMMNVEVNVINKTGVEANVNKSAPRMDAGKLILDVVLDAANRNKGGFKNKLKGALG